jgi:hypothetical protein
MNAASPLSAMLIGAGLAGMLVSALDLLEGCFFVLPSVAVATAGAWLGRSRHRTLLSWASALVAIGVAAMVVLTKLGGLGGDSGNSIWWAITILPYPIGWLLGLAGATLTIIESCRRCTTAQRSRNLSLR